MGIIIAHASIDENGKIHGGKAGDQNKKEVTTRSYYLSAKGWRVFRAKDSKARAKIAEAALSAANNDNIGYDQYNRDSLWNFAKPHNYDPSKVTEKCETDCSALIRVCCAYAGILLSNFNTATEPSVLLGSGQFYEVTSSIDTNSGLGLLVGDILVTKSKGHTVVVTQSAQASTKNTYSIKGRIVRTIKKGARGELVRLIQTSLISRGYYVGRIDSDFGDKTEAAVKKIQSDRGIEVDGVVGPSTWKILL